MVATSTVPTRVYAYGCRVEDASIDPVFAQLHAAHGYKNTLVAIELGRRARVDKLLSDLSPTLQQVEVDMANLKQQVEMLKAAGNRERVANHSRRITPAIAAQITQAKKDLRVLFEKRKLLRATLFADPAFKVSQEAIDNDINSLQKEARANCGVYWGTYLTVEDSMKDARKGAPPKFHRWDGNGRVAVQIQGGADAADVAYGDGNNTLIQIDQEPDKLGRSKPWRKARIRIGSTDKGKSVWADLLIKLHRPIPSDCRIKWAWLLAKRIGTHTKWSLQVVLARTAGWASHGLAERGTVAVDVGWRVLSNGDLRAAYWVGDDGREGQVIIPAERIERLRKVFDLHSIRAKRFDAVRAAIAPILKTLNAPPWVAERLVNLPHWKSQARLASVVLFWRNNRFPGDTAIYDLIEEWRKKDKHLYDWEAAQSHGEQLWRQDLYRKTSAMLSESYRTAIIEDSDWSVFAKNDPMEKDCGHFETPDLFRRTAAVSILNLCLKHRMKECIKASAVNTTQTCHACGSLEDFDAAAHLNHTCLDCGAKWDQDRNACLNLLNGSAQTVP